MYSHCGNGGGWILGNTIDGTQAEYVRIPFADTSLDHVPKGADEDALVMLIDLDDNRSRWRRRSVRLSDQQHGLRRPDAGDLPRRTLMG